MRSIVYLVDTIGLFDYPKKIINAATSTGNISVVEYAVQRLNWIHILSLTPIENAIMHASQTGQLDIA